MNPIATAKSYVTVRALQIVGGLFAVAAIIAAIQTVRIEGVWCSDAAPDEKPSCLMKGFKQDVQVYRFTISKVAASRDAEIAKHKATKDAYRDAQIEATDLEAKRLAAVVARQERITTDVASEYRQRIAALHARVDSLRAQARAAAAGSGVVGEAGGVAVPGASSAAAGAYDPALCQEIPARSLDVELYCRGQAEENATRLEALISWVSRQMQVEN